MEKNYGQSPKKKKYGSWYTIEGDKSLYGNEGYKIFNNKIGSHDIFHHMKIHHFYAYIVSIECESREYRVANPSRSPI